MIKELRLNVIRILLLLFVQVFLLKDIQIYGGSEQYLYIIIYPLGLLLLPLSLPQFFVILIAFVCGFTVDLFYKSIGVHASASMWMVAARPLILKYLEPKTGYGTGVYLNAHHLGIFWFIRYILLGMTVFLFSYFCMEIFTLVYLDKILIKTLVSLMVSCFILFLIQIIVNPKY
jgi:hypothetical protein